MTDAPCSAGCNRGLTSSGDVCPVCRGSGEAEPAPVPRKRPPVVVPPNPVAPPVQQVVFGVPMRAPDVAPKPVARFAELKALSAKRDAETPVTPSDETSASSFVRVRREAASMFGEGRLGLLRWIDMRGQMMRPQLHPLDPFWLDAFAGYYASGKLIMVCRKGLRAGGSSSACPALVRCALFADRHLDAGTIGVIPIMSATRDEADGRFVTIRALLRAAGLTPEKKRGDDDDEGTQFVVPPGGVSGTFKSKRSPAGGGIIAINDMHGHPIEFRILPALVRHGVGYTGVAGFADESDLWPNDPELHVNPAERIFDRITERFTTVPSAELLIFSASYNADSAHKRLIDEGDTPLQHVVRLGVEGAKKDEIARRRLAVVHLGGMVGVKQDPRLLEPGDPNSPDIPAWAANPSAAPIERCFTLSKGNISRMLALYGGRAAENVRENCPMGDVEIRQDERSYTANVIDIVVGVAPPDAGSNEWGLVCVALVAGHSFLAVEDGSAPMSGVDAVAWIRACQTASVLACALDQEKRLAAEIMAATAGIHAPVAPVAPQAIVDASVLRTGPLATLYRRGLLAHSMGLGALANAVQTWAPDGPRVPRVEALVAAVKRLVDCYPWLTAGHDQEPVTGPRALDATDVGRLEGFGAGDVLRRLGAR